MKIHNNTQFTLEQVERFKRIGETINKWRGRRITLYEHPEFPDHVISDGITFDNSMRVICQEPRTDWTTALDYIAHGKVYISE